MRFLGSWVPKVPEVPGFLGSSVLGSETARPWHGACSELAPWMSRSAIRISFVGNWRTNSNSLVFELTEAGPVSKDFKFRDQIRDSSSSSTRCMAEGFGRFWPREHAALLRMGKASLFETHNSAGAGFRKGYFTREQSEKMQRLAKRSGKAATNLIRYLESLPPRQYPGKKCPLPENPGT